MNSHIDSINARKAELVQAFLNQVPGRVSAIVENWQQLVQSDWDGQLLGSLLERLQTLSEAAAKFGVSQIHQNSQSLASHLGQYGGAGNKPKHDEVVALDGLVHAFRELANQACQQHRPPPPGTDQASALAEQPEVGGRLILLLGIEGDLAAALSHHLHSQGFQVKRLSSAEAVFEHLQLNPDDQGALISHTRWLSELYPGSNEPAGKGTSREGGLWHREGGRAGIPVIFIADDSDLQTRLTVMRSEAKAFYSQPIDPYLVATRMRELTAPANQTPDRVLIVDDDPSQADFAAAILGKAGFECRIVTEPLKVMDALADFRPDLVLMDLYMPEASGTELTRVIHEQSEFVDTPIVFLSGEQDLDKQLKALSFGGEDFLAKPIGPKHLISTVTNRIQRARQLTHRLGEFSRGDTATGLFTRHYLLERLDALLSAARTERPEKQQEVSAIFYLDVDNADEIIHSAGIGGMDVVLAEIGRHLSGLLKPQDVLSRFGDNSLGLLLCRPSLDALEAFGQRLCEEIAGKILEVDNHTLGVTLSIGAYPIGPDDQDSNALCSRARLASEVAREQGGNRVYLQRPERQPVATEESDTAFKQLLIEAIEKDYLEIYFQPIVALKGNSVAHYQTLLRLQEPGGKLLAARDFIPKAEQLGLISRVDQWTTRTALAVINQLRAQGDQLHLFISQSGELMENMERLSWLQEKHRKGLIQPGELTIEFRIAEVAKNLNSAKPCFDMLGRMGITTLLTGVDNSREAQRTLNYLPVHYIKLDSELLQGPPPPLNEAISLAHSLHIKVIAPQVEEPRSIARLWSSGTDFVQGNFVQRPEHGLAYDFNESILN